MTYGKRYGKRTKKEGGYMQQIVIYGDVLFCINFVMDFLLLWATAKFGKYATTFSRLCAAAFVGAIYGVGMLIPAWNSAYHIYYKLLFPVLLFGIAFGPLRLKRLVQGVVYFYGIGFAMGGAALGGSALWQQHVPVMTGGSWWSSLPIGVLVFAGLVALGLGFCGIRYVKRNWHRQNFLIPADIILNGKKGKLTVLLDTGNELREPLSKTPVLVVEYHTVRHLFPAHICFLLDKYLAEDVTKIFTECKDGIWTRRMKLIPFQSIGREHGMLLGIQPDQVVLYGKETVQTKDVIVAISNYSLGKRGYQGIANTDILAIEDSLREVMSL